MSDAGFWIFPIVAIVFLGGLMLAFQLITSRDTKAAMENASRDNKAAMENAKATLEMVMSVNRTLELRVDKLETLIRVQRSWIDLLSGQLGEKGVTPVTYEAAIAASGVSLTIFDTHISTLLSSITEHYDTSELNILARTIGFPPDEVKGNNRSERAAELIDMAKRNNKLDNLISQIKRDRPTVKIQNGTT